MLTHPYTMPSLVSWSDDVVAAIMAETTPLQMRY